MNAHFESGAAMTNVVDEFDPITLEIIQNSLQAAADEMFGTLRHTAMSAIIYEVLDMGTGITDRNGELAGSGAGIPSFVGVLDKSVKALLKRFDQPNAIEPGDIFLVNDPYHGGVTHLNDMVLAMPVFFEGEIIAWTANIAHWNDVGGMVPGSMSTKATEIFQEGMIYPGIKVVAHEEPIQAVFDILTANCRMPDFLLGDLWAGIAAVRVGSLRLLELARKYGKDIFLEAIERFLDYGEQVSLMGLKQLPKGRFSLEEPQDNGQVYHVEIEITDDRFIVDLRNNAEQDPGPFNMSADRSTIMCQIAFKNLTSSTRLANSGTFRPLRVLLKEGTVFNPRYPAAMGIYYEIGIRLHDLIMRCLAPHMPERIPAGGFASICGTLFGGVHPDTGRSFAIIEPEIGGWGASSRRDGASGQYSAVHGDTYNCPAEVAEARYGVTVEHLSFHDEPGGAGRFRGGKGVRLDYRIRSEHAWLTVAYTRSKHPPWPLNGGQPGSPNHIVIRRSNGQRETHAVTDRLPLQKGDVIQIMTATGAGWGDPLQRDLALVQEDIKNEFISQAQADALYGFSLRMQKERNA